MNLTPSPKKGRNAGIPWHILAKYQEGGNPEDMKKKKKAPTQSQGIIAIPIPPQMQLGGLGDLAGFDLSGIKGVMSGMEGIDFNDYNSVLAAGNKIGGQNFADAVAADDPLKMTGLPEMARAMAVQQKPVWQKGTPEYDAEFNRRVQERGIDLLPRQQRLREKDRISRELERESRNNQMFGQGIQTVQNTIGAANQAVGLGSILDLMSGFQFQKGGTADRSIQGYSDGSPYKSLPYIMIPGNTIDMSNTGMPILAVADSGETRVLPPYSGQHQFPGASQVKEMPAVPKKKKGGKKYRYQQGGPGAIGAQLEVGEVFATPNVDIIDTNATQKHKDMPKDLVTDILGPQDYVFSSLPNFKITRKQAEELSDKVGGVLYEEGQVKDLPKTYGPIDLFKEGEDEVQLSEYVKRIRDSFKVRPDEKEDPFVRKTNAGNKESRIPFLEAAAAVNEMKRGGNQVVGYASNFENRFNDSIWADANPVRKAGVYSAYDSTEAVQEAMLAAQQPEETGMMPGAMAEGGPPKMVVGAIVGAAMAAANLIGGAIKKGQQRRAERRMADTQAKLDAYWDPIRERQAQQQQIFGMMPALLQMNQQASTPAAVPQYAPQDMPNGMPAYMPSQVYTPQFQQGSTTSGAAAGNGMPWWGWVGAGTNLIGGIINSINAGAQARRNYRIESNALANDRREIDRLAGIQSQYNVASMVPVLGGIVGQNPFVEAPQYDTSQLDATVRRMPGSLFDLAAARLTANARPYTTALSANAGNFGQIVAGAAPVYAGNANAMATIGMGEADRNIQMENQYRMAKQGYSDRQIEADTAALNATRANSNRLISDFSGVIGSTVRGQGNITSDQINAQRENSMRLAQAQLNKSAGQAQAWNALSEGIVGAGSNLVSLAATYMRQPDTQIINNNNSQAPQSPAPPPSGPQPRPPIPYDPINPTPPPPDDPGARPAPVDPRDPGGPWEYPPILPPPIGPDQVPPRQGPRLPWEQEPAPDTRVPQPQPPRLAPREPQPIPIPPRPGAGVPPPQAPPQQPAPQQPAPAEPPAQQPPAQQPPAAPPPQAPAPQQPAPREAVPPPAPIAPRPDQQIPIPPREGAQPPRVGEVEPSIGGSQPNSPNPQDRISRKEALDRDAGRTGLSDAEIKEARERAEKRIKELERLEKKGVTEIDYAGQQRSVKDLKKEQEDRKAALEPDYGPTTKKQEAAIRQYAQVVQDMEGLARTIVKDPNSPEAETARRLYAKAKAEAERLYGKIPDRVKEKLRYSHRDSEWALS